MTRTYARPDAKAEADVVTAGQAPASAVGSPGSALPDLRPWPSPPNPGDLGRRLAARRTELRLSVAQVARRAGLSARYLDYLEKFPGHPQAATLRQLAAALRTTPAALLGADEDTPPGGTLGPAAGILEPLALAECHRLLAPGGVGRIAFVAAGGIMVLPVNYAVTGGRIVLRTGPGSVIAAHGDDSVSFEADHFDEVLGQGWSVLVHGRAHCVTRPGELAYLRHERKPEPWPAGERGLFIKIAPDRISGRRIRTQ
jgi:transcriptional regulator with XRE-family HTH domain